MRRLAAELDVTTNTVYWHVGSRDALITEIIRTSATRLADRAITGATPRERSPPLPPHLGQFLENRHHLAAHQTGTTPCSSTISSSHSSTDRSRRPRGDAAALALRSIFHRRWLPRGRPAGRIVVAGRTPTRRLWSTTSGDISDGRSRPRHSRPTTRPSSPPPSRGCRRPHPRLTFSSPSPQHGSIHTMTESTAPQARRGEIAAGPARHHLPDRTGPDRQPAHPDSNRPVTTRRRSGSAGVLINSEPEYGVSIKVPASWQGVEGQYNLGMGIDQEAAVHISAERNGQPKFLCHIDYFRPAYRRCRATHQGYTFVEFEGQVTGEGQPSPSTSSTSGGQNTPEIGGGEFDFGPVVVDVATTMEPIHVETVEGELTLKDSPWDPVARYRRWRRCLRFLVTHQMKSREITNAGALDADSWPADVIGGCRWPGTNGGPKN